MSTPQPGILAPVPNISRYLEFGAVPDPNPVPVLRDLASWPIDQEFVVGVGPGLVQGLGQSIEGLLPLPNPPVYGKELFSVHARFGGDSGRISSSGDQGLRGGIRKTYDFRTPR